MVLPGAFAAHFYQDLPNNDYVFPALIFDLLPVGIRGLILEQFK